MKKLIMSLLLALLILPSLVGCSYFIAPDDSVIAHPGLLFMPDVKVQAAYCNYGLSSLTPSFDLHFTLKNLQDEDSEINYKWTLNDPMADKPVLQGEGNTLLLEDETKPIVIHLSQDYDFDPRFYVIYVGVYRDNKQIGYYREQKSTYDWDYNTLPPVIRTEKQPNNYVWIETFVEKTLAGYRVNIDNIIFLPPERTAILDLNNIRIHEGPLLADILTRRAGPDNMTFHDADNNGELSIGDYLSMDRGSLGESIGFESRDEPSICINKVGYSAETIEEENKESIRIQNVIYKVIDDKSLEIEVQVSSDKPLKHVDVKFYVPGDGGVSSSGDHLEPPVVGGDTLIYRKVVEHILPDKGDLYLFVFITDGTNEVLHLVGEIN